MGSRCRHIAPNAMLHKSELSSIGSAAADVGSVDRAAAVAVASVGPWPGIALVAVKS